MAQGDKYQKIIRHLGEPKVREMESLAKYTTFKLGGPADLFFESRTGIDLIRAVTVCQELDVPYVILGGGSNVIISDRGYRGLVISNKKGAIERLDSTLIEITSGTPNYQIVRYILDHSLSGLEFLVGIPGTIGGAIRNNGRFRNPESFQKYFTDFHLVQDQFVSESLEEALLLSPSGTIFWADKEYIKPLYHETQLKQTNDVIISARFKLKEESQDIIRKSTKEQLLWRKSRSIKPNPSQESEGPSDPITGHRASQPKHHSPGCIFSNTPNPENHPVGRMLDMCGLKGMRIGDIMVAHEHANYIVNLGQGTATDALALIKLCKDRVKQSMGVDLHLEVDLIGEF